MLQRQTDVVQWMLYNGCCTMDAVQWMLYNGCCTMDVVQWMLYNGCCTMDAVQWMLYNGCCTMDVVQWMLLFAAAFSFYSGCVYMFLLRTMATVYVGRQYVFCECYIFFIFLHLTVNQLIMNDKYYNVKRIDILGRSCQHVSYFHFQVQGGLSICMKIMKMIIIQCNMKMNHG